MGCRSSADNGTYRAKWNRKGVERTGIESPSMFASDHEPLILDPGYLTAVALGFVVFLCGVYLIAVVIGAGVRRGWHQEESRSRRAADRPPSRRVADRPTVPVEAPPPMRRS